MCCHVFLHVLTQQAVSLEVRKTFLLFLMFELASDPAAPLWEWPLESTKQNKIPLPFRCDAGSIYHLWLSGGIYIAIPFPFLELIV